VKAYGQRDVEANLPVAPTTQFVIGSITKSFTATAVALLHNEVASTGPYPCATTFRSFVCTTRWRASGQQCETSCVINLACRAMIGCIFQATAQPPNCSASCVTSNWAGISGGGLAIRNLCYNVAGLLIERVSGQSYEAFMRTRLTDRLGMKVGFTLDDLEAHPSFEQWC
jgi:CubicO group peptidase (beta-lactamase class C family)